MDSPIEIKCDHKVVPPEEKNQLVEFFLNQNQKLDLLYQKFGKKVRELALASD